MKDIIEQFTKVAPFIVAAVKARMTGCTTEAQLAVIIHEEIVNYFEAQMNMAAQYIAFDANQRRAFAGVMYDVLMGVK